MQILDNALRLQIILFLLILTGFFAHRKGFITSGSRKHLTNLFIQVILPCNIIYSFKIDLTTQLVQSAGLVLIISFGVQFFQLLVSKLTFKRVAKDKQVVARYGTICSNSGFMGNPVVEGIYGLDGLMFASISLIPVRIFMWSAGLSLFTTIDKKAIFKKLALHPCIIAVYIGIGLMLINFNLPTPIIDTLKLISNCTTAIAMFIIGSILAEVEWKNLFDRVSIGFSILRLLLIPLSVLVILRLLNAPTLLTNISVLLAAMPAGSTTAILAEQYKGNAQYASKLILLSTTFSIITLPAIMLLLQVI